MRSVSLFLLLDTTAGGLMSSTGFHIVTASLLTLFLAVGSLLFLPAHPPVIDPAGMTKRPDTSRPIRVALLNGCGREGLAAVFADRLRRRGYDVLNGQGVNADSFDFDRSVVVDRRGNRALANSVSDDLGISLTTIQIASDPYVLEDIVIILGRDWDRLAISGEDIRE